MVRLKFPSQLAGMEKATASDEYKEQFAGRSEASARIDRERDHRGLISAKSGYCCCTMNLS
jgi:hypothetical protein